LIEQRQQAAQLAFPADQLIARNRKHTLIIPGASDIPTE
jgi:hypothetical protein